MSVWADPAAADELAVQARPVRVLAVATGWAKAAWPQLVRAGSGAADAFAAVFVAAGWVLGFGVFCLKGAVYGFCSGAGFSQPSEWAARRRAARTQGPGPS